MQINNTISGQTYSASNTKKSDMQNSNSDVWTQRITDLANKHASEVAENYNKGDFSDIKSHTKEISSLYRKFYESRGGVWKGPNFFNHSIEEIKATAGGFIGNEHIEEFSGIYQSTMKSELNRLGVDMGKFRQFEKDREDFNTIA
jgi:hypothetical protein